MHSHSCFRFIYYSNECDNWHERFVCFLSCASLICVDIFFFVGLKYTVWLRKFNFWDFPNDRKTKKRITTHKNEMECIVDKRESKLWRRKKITYASKTAEHSVVHSSCSVCEHTIMGRPFVHNIRGKHMCIGRLPNDSNWKESSNVHLCEGALVHTHTLKCKHTFFCFFFLRRWNTLAPPKHRREKFLSQ